MGISPDWIVGEEEEWGLKWYLIPCIFCLGRVIEEFKKKYGHPPDKKTLSMIIMKGEFQGKLIPIIPWSPTVESVCMRLGLIADRDFFKACPMHRASIWPSFADLEGDLLAIIGEFAIERVGPETLEIAGLPKEFVDECVRRYFELATRK